jgi:hypothetical protein
MPLRQDVGAAASFLYHLGEPAPLALNAPQAFQRALAQIFINTLGHPLRRRAIVD